MSFFNNQNEINSSYNSIYIVTYETKIIHKIYDIYKVTDLDNDDYYYYLAYYGQSEENYYSNSLMRNVEDFISYLDLLEKINS